jgi:N-acetylmuramoyl-L-alanine amidase
LWIIKPAQREEIRRRFAFPASGTSAVFCGVPGQHELREGDEIVVAGQFFHTGTKVVLWMDPGGYDAYRFELT